MRQEGISERGLFWTPYLQVLTFLDGPNELRRFEQGIVSTCVEPGVASTERLDVQLANLEIGTIHIGDLVLTSARLSDGSAVLSKGIEF